MSAKEPAGSKLIAIMQRDMRSVAAQNAVLSPRFIKKTLADLASHNTVCEMFGDDYQHCAHEAVGCTYIGRTRRHWR